MEDSYLDSTTISTKIHSMNS